MKGSMSKSNERFPRVENCGVGIQKAEHGKNQRL